MLTVPKTQLEVNSSLFLCFSLAWLKHVLTFSRTVFGVYPASWMHNLHSLESCTRELRRCLSALEHDACDSSGVIMWQYRATRHPWPYAAVRAAGGWMSPGLHNGARLLGVQIRRHDLCMLHCAGFTVSYVKLDQGTFISRTFRECVKLLLQNIKKKKKCTICCWSILG